MERPLATALVLTVLAVACGGKDREPRTTGATGTAQPSAGAGLPGERQEIFPYEGAKLAVAGVAADDTLNVRSGPGTDFAVVLELPPTAMNATATGHNRSRDAGFWSEITVEGRTGWANTAFLLQPGDVNDITAALFPTPAQRPTEKTMLELGRAVARIRTSHDQEADIVVVENPTVGDVGEITVDIVGLADDSVGGERLKIFAEAAPRNERFTVRSVEATTFCRRGVTPERLCA